MTYPKKVLPDKLLLEQLDAIKDLNFREKLDKLIIKSAIGTKVKLGLGLDENIHKKELANELQKEYRKPIHLLKVKVFAKDDVWTLNLVFSL